VVLGLFASLLTVHVAAGSGGPPQLMRFLGCPLPCRPRPVAAGSGGPPQLMLFLGCAVGQFSDVPGSQEAHHVCLLQNPQKNQRKGLLTPRGCDISSGRPLASALAKQARRLLRCSSGGRSTETRSLER